MTEASRRRLRSLARNFLDKRFDGINFFDLAYSSADGVSNVKARTDVARSEFIFVATAFGFSHKIAASALRDVYYEFIHNHSNAYVGKFLEKAIKDGNNDLAFSIICTLTETSQVGLR